MAQPRSGGGYRAAASERPYLAGTTPQRISCVIVALMLLSSSKPRPLPGALIEIIARRLRCFAEPMRIRLLDRLPDREVTVTELQAATGASQQNVSEHFGVLQREGVVRRSKPGNSAVYAIAAEDVFDLCERVGGSVRRQAAGLDLLPNGGAS